MRRPGPSSVRGAVCICASWEPSSTGRGGVQARLFRSRDAPRAHNAQSTYAEKHCAVYNAPLKYVGNLRLLYYAGALVGVKSHLLYHVWASVAEKTRLVYQVGASAAEKRRAVYHAAIGSAEKCRGSYHAEAESAEKYRVAYHFGPLGAVESDFLYQPRLL